MKYQQVTGMTHALVYFYITNGDLMVSKTCTLQITPKVTRCTIWIMPVQSIVKLMYTLPSHYYQCDIYQSQYDKGGFRPKLKISVRLQKLL